MNKFKDFVLNNNLGQIETNYSFKELTTLKIGGKIRILYYPNSIDSLIKSYKYIINNKLQYFVIGNGSNILVSDNYFNGIVISLKNLKNYTVNNNVLNIEAGATYIDLVYLLKNNIGGLEELATIPGTIGGMIYNNAGCFKKSVSDILIDVSFLNEDGSIVVLKKEELKYQYRYSIFKEKKGIILSARFNVLNNSDYSYYKHLMNKRKNKQPITYHNVGSIFKNNFDIPVWQIIDKINLRGHRINDAMISTIHANFIVNLNNASFNDMNLLIKQTIKKAKLINYNLELEIEIVTF